MSSSFIKLVEQPTLPPPLREDQERRDIPIWTADLLREIDTLYRNIRNEFLNDVPLHYIREAQNVLYPASTETTAITWVASESASNLLAWLFQWEIPSPPSGNRTCTLRAYIETLTPPPAREFSFRMDREPEGLHQEYILLTSDQIIKKNVSFFVTVEPSVAVTMDIVNRFSYLQRADFA